MIPNYRKNFYQFILSCGIYLNSQKDADFVTDVLGIKPVNRWNTSRKEGRQKRKFLVCFGNNWKYIALHKEDIDDQIDIVDFKRMLKDVVCQTVVEVQSE